MAEDRSAPGQPGSERRGAWLVAVLAALLWHGGFLVALRSLHFPDPAAAVARHDGAIAVDLVPAPPAARTNMPRPFTEQPDDGSSDPAGSADLLSNVDATARDLIPGGADPMPNQTGSADAPQVAMSPGAEGGADGDAEADAEAAEEATAAAEPAKADGDAAGTPAAPATMPPLLAEGLRAAAQRQLPAARPGTKGTSDLFQEAMDSAMNAAAAGDIRLSTTKWDYAPWLQAFRRELLQRWHPPQAYFLGMIQGWVVIEVEVARDGKLLDLRVLDQEVDHWSLTDAADKALRRAAPYRALPDAFPDETLKLQIRFVYAGARR